MINKITLSRNLRKEQTSTERILWGRLRSRQLAGLKFKRQYSIGPFITDFYCHEKKIIIEIDGDVHDLPEKRVQDERRDRYFIESGYKVLHINNDDVIHNLDGVLEEIMRS